MSKLIRIELSVEEAESFRVFRENEKDFTVLSSAGIFNFKNGWAIIHRDLQGTLKSIDIKIKTFERKKDGKR